MVNSKLKVVKNLLRVAEELTENSRTSSFRHTLTDQLKRNGFNKGEDFHWGKDTNTPFEIQLFTDDTKCLEAAIRLARIKNWYLFNKTKNSLTFLPIHTQKVNPPDLYIAVTSADWIRIQKTGLKPTALRPEHPKLIVAVNKSESAPWRAKLLTGYVILRIRTQSLGCWRVDPSFAPEDSTLMSYVYDRNIPSNLLEVIPVYKPRIAAADLSPSLGSGKGGPELIKKRIQDRALPANVSVAIQSAISNDRDPTPEQIRQLYPVLRVRGPEPFTILNLLPHAQYRMDLRCVTVTAIYKSLEAFVKQIRIWMNSKDPQQRIKVEALYKDQYDWIDPVSNLKIGIAVSRHNPGSLDIKTVFYQGKQGQEPWRK
jgi:hypothetical protein